MGVEKKFTDQLISLNTAAAHDEVKILGERYGVSAAEVMRTVTRIGLPGVEKEFRLQGLKPVRTPAQARARVEAERARRSGRARTRRTAVPEATFQPAA